MIRSHDEQLFIASLAAYDRSWIGLRRENDIAPWKWLYEAEGLTLTSEFWAQDPSVHSNEALCASIDSRGARKNVDARSCEEGFHLLCEFDSAKKAKQTCQVKHGFYIEFMFLHRTTFRPFSYIKTTSCRHFSFVSKRAIRSIRSTLPSF